MKRTGNLQLVKVAPPVPATEALTQWWADAGIIAEATLHVTSPAFSTAASLAAHLALLHFWLQDAFEFWFYLRTTRCTWACLISWQDYCKGGRMVARPARYVRIDFWSLCLTQIVSRAEKGKKGRNRSRSDFGWNSEVWKKTCTMWSWIQWKLHSFVF